MRLQDSPSLHTWQQLSKITTEVLQLQMSDSARDDEMNVALQTITQKMADQERSDIRVGFTMILWTLIL